MLTKSMKWVAIVALLGALLWRSGVNYGTFLQFAVSAGALAVLAQAANLRRYLWMWAFVAVAFLFNPILPLTFATGFTTTVNATALVLFAVSLAAMKVTPRLSIVSITDRTPGSESL